MYKYKNIEINFLDLSVYYISKSSSMSTIDVNFVVVVVVVVIVGLINRSTHLIIYLSMSVDKLNRSRRRRRSLFD